MKTPDPATPPTTSAPKGTNVVALPGAQTDLRPSEKVIAFVKRHPALTVAGGIVIGVAVSALIPRKASRRLIGKAVDLAEAAGAASVVFGKRAGERAHDASIDAARQASALAHKAEEAGGAAIHNIEKYSLAALATASAIGKATAKRTSRFADVAADAAERISEATAQRAQRLGQSASEGSTKVVHFADDLRKRAKSRH